MTGTDTIAKIRALGVGALIVGSSGNNLAAEHLGAGADLFWRKPLPGPITMVRDIGSRLHFPATWRVLFADDCMVIGLVMQRKLVGALPVGAEVTLVTSGEDALAAMAAPFDLIILDQNMSADGMTGAEVAKVARDRGSTSIIVGFSGASLEAEFLAAGCDLCWTKSIDESEIKSSLVKCPNKYISSIAPRTHVHLPSTRRLHVACVVI